MRKLSYIKFFDYFITGLVIIWVLSFVVKNTFWEEVIDLLLLFLAISPVLWIFYNSRFKKIFIQLMFYYAIEMGILVLSFKKIRSFFPPTEIGDGRVIGYAHYFGYPFYFDTWLFIVIIFSPLCMLLLIKIARNIRRI